MPEAIRKHRHLILAPILVAIVAYSVVDQSSMSAKISEENKFGLISTDGYTQIEAGKFKISSMIGGFTVNTQRDNVTVAAITSPVLIEDEDGLVLVPINHRWKGSDIVSLDEGIAAWDKSHEVQLLPVSYVKEQLELMSQIPGEKETEEDVLRFVSKDALLTVQLPLARQEAEAKRAKEDFDDLRKYVKAGEFKEAWNLFNELKENDVLGKEMLIKLFPEVSANPPLADAVLQLVINDYQTWLLASSHPELRRFAWAVGAPKMSDEAALVEITSFPKSDVSKEAVEDSIRHYWEERVIKRANSLEGSTGFLLYIIDILIESVEEFRADGYPVRAEAYTETILRLADEFDYKIDNETAYRIMQLVREQKVRIFDEGGSIEEKKEIEEEKEAVELTPDEVKSKAYEILRDAGALFTVKTEINPVSSTTAEVSGIIFFDQERVFELDVVNSEVSQIVHEGRVMPFSLPISAYVSWASK